MLNFKEIQLGDIPLLNAFFSSNPSRQCDKTAGATAMWKDYYKTRFAVTDETLIMMSEVNGLRCLSYPVGKNVDAALDKAREYCEKEHIPLVFCSVNNNDLEKLIKKYPECTFDSDRNWFDYLYEKDALLNLTGKKYATARNHINRFKKDNPVWTFEPVSKNNIEELLCFTKNFTFGASKDESALSELEFCARVLENYEAYGMFGGVLKVENTVAGYSVGETLGDTLFCHIEKADISFSGAYQMLTNQFLKMYASNENIKYVNREEDCGDEGLRKSKLSYHPSELIRKSTVVVGKL